MSRQVAASGEGLHLETPACQAAQESAFALAGNQVAFYEEWQPKGVIQDDAINLLAAYVLTLKDFGCTGDPPRFSGVEQVVGFLGALTPTAKAKADPACTGHLQGLEGSQNAQSLANYLDAEQRGVSQAPWMLQFYYRAAAAGCVEVPW